jgi:hypothetical protein
MFKFSYTYSKWILLGLILIAAALRFFGSNSISLNFEEQLFWFVGSQESILDAFALTKQFFFANPFLAITAWLTNFSDFQSELLSRLPSLIAGIAAIPLIFFLARKFYSELEGFISAGFVAFGWIFIAQSETLSEHSIFFAEILFYFISLMTFLDRISVEQIATKLDFILLIFSGLLLGFTSFWGIIVVLITIFYSFFLIKKTNSFIKTLSALVIILIPLAFFVYFSLKSSLFFTGNSLNFHKILAIFNQIIANNFILTAIICSPLVFIFYIYLKKIIKPKDFGEDAKTNFGNSTLILTIWFVGNLLFFVIISYFFHPIFDYNDLIFLLPPIIILISRGIILSTKKFNNQIILSLIYCIFIISVSIFNIGNINSNPDYNQVTRYIMRTSNKINSTKNQNFGIVFSGRFINPVPISANYFYLKKNHISLPTFSFNGKIENIEKVLSEAKAKKINYLWFICDKTLINENFLQHLRNKSNIIDGFSYNKIILMKIKV